MHHLQLCGVHLGDPVSLTLQRQGLGSISDRAARAFSHTPDFTAITNDISSNKRDTFDETREDFKVILTKTDHGRSPASHPVETRSLARNPGVSVHS